MLRENLPVFNMQPQEHVVSDPNVLDVQQIWYTIQGEGPYAGMPATFIRLAGCNLQCNFCDTDYTSKRRTMTVKEIVHEVHSVRQLPPSDTYWGKRIASDKADCLVVITGGEPFRQAIGNLTRTLAYANNIVQVESNGTVWQEDNWPPRFEIVCSPKTSKIHPEIAKRMMALKYVIHHEHVDPIDGLPTSMLGCGEKMRPARPSDDFAGSIFIQPEDTKDPATWNENLKACVLLSKRFGYRLGVQLHKLVGEE